MAAPLPQFLLSGTLTCPIPMTRAILPFKSGKMGKVDGSGLVLVLVLSAMLFVLKCGDSSSQFIRGPPE